MTRRKAARAVKVSLATLVAASLLAGCASTRQPYSTRRDKTAKGAGVGAAVGVVGALIAGKSKADQILVGAVLGAGIGAGVGAYMDAQEEKIARIPGTKVERVDNRTLLVHFDSDVLFAVDSAAIDSAGSGTLDNVAGVLEEYSKTAVVIQGHTDSTGSDEHNQALSERRADSVLQYLAGRGVDRGRMDAEGFGETAPVASNDSESGRQLNRRVDIMLRAKA